MPPDRPLPAPTDEQTEMVLLKLRFKYGRLIEASARKPLLLNDPQYAWVVYTGQVNVFALPLKDGAPDGARYHLFQCDTAQGIFGMETAERGPGVGLLAVGNTGTRLIRLPRTRLQHLVQQEQDAYTRTAIIGLLEKWVNSLSTGLLEEPAPIQCLELDPGGEMILPAAGLAQGLSELRWVQAAEGQLRFLGIPGMTLPPQRYFPLGQAAWLLASTPARLRLAKTPDWLAGDAHWESLDHFHQTALQCAQLRIEQLEKAERQRLHQKAEAGERFVQNAFRRLSSVLKPEAAVSFESSIFVAPDPLLAACQLIGAAQGLNMIPPSDRRVDGRKEDFGDALRAIARASRLHYRRVTLAGEWWRTEHGPLLAFRRSPEDPEALEYTRAVALLPERRGYMLHEPFSKQPTRLTAEIAATLAPAAFMFYRPFSDKALKAADLVRFGLQGSRADLRGVLLVGVAIGLLGTFPPVATGLLFDTVIPSASRSQLWQLGLALLISALCAALFHITRNIALLRLEGRLSASLQAALWDRLLRLPVPFFRDYTAGDLAERTLGMEMIRRTVFNTAISALLTGLFSTFNYLLLFYYDPRLAGLATLLVLASMGITVATGLLHLRYTRQQTNLQGELSGSVLQFINGIPKFRAAGAEGWAFSRWAKKFSAQKQVALKSRSIENALVAFNTAFPLLTLLATFAMIAYAFEAHNRLTTGAFLGFTAAFTQFLMASLAISGAFIAILAIVPAYERVSPILKALPEVNALKSDPGRLRGEIEISHVAFRYKEDEPLVLRDISLHVRAGEFVALVGPSGSGKSTLLRLLLGFEAPLSGAIYFDKQDLNGLDTEAVRRQIGVVLQNSKLISGDIFTNIVGATSLTLDDAWHAARRVGLDGDIEQMPMGMHTLISEGGGNLSGGQRQRILIARAIVRQPSMLFFDEATSALDNRTQAVVSESLERLRATRIVIAHRLSTIRNADCIYVIENGQVVQKGSYRQLMQQPGLFTELARRQLA